MKKLVGIILMIGLTACSGPQAKREVINNQFLSDRPKMAIKIDNDFIYEEKRDSGSYSLFPGYERGANIKKEEFVFLNQKEETYILIVISTISEGFWKTNTVPSHIKPLDMGYVKQGGQKYKYIIFVHKGEGDRCFLVKRYIKTAGWDSSILQAVYYGKEIKPHLGGYEDWQVHSALSGKQTDFLSHFLSSSSQDITFLDQNDFKK